MFKATITKKHRLRFVANGSAFAGVITNSELLDLLCVAISATTAARVCDGMKISKVDIWAANSAGNSSNTAELEWLNEGAIGAYFGPGVTVSDTALGVTDIAHVSTTPPVGSSAAFWLNDAEASYELMRLSIPQGGVVDVILDIVLFDNDDPRSVLGSLSGATPGKFYCRALDNSDSTPVLKPVSYDTI